MTATLQAAPSPSKTRIWTGRILSAIPVLFLLMDGVMKLVKPAPVLEAMASSATPQTSPPPSAPFCSSASLLYVVPQTSVFGAILLTGYLGGAIAAHVRVGNPLFSHILFPLYIALLLWGGLFLREPRLRALLALRS